MRLPARPAERTKTILNIPIERDEFIWKTKPTFYVISFDRYTVKIAGDGTIIYKLIYNTYKDV